LFYLDISSPKARSIGGSKFWLLIIDHFSDMCWSFFMKNKSDLPDRVMELLQLLHRDKLISGKPKIRLDNSSENEALEVRMRTDSVGANFEFTAPGSPQFAGVVERKFATLFARVRSILNSARLSQDLRNGLWAEAAKYATDVENSLISGSRKASSWSMFYKKESPINRNLRQFREIAILDNHQKRGFHSKLENRGYAALYLGHADNHASDVYRFLNLETKCVVWSRDCTWLNKTYASYKEIEGVVLITDDDDDAIDSIVTGTSETVIVPQPHLVAPPVGNNLNDNNDLAEPNIDDPYIPLELRNLQQSFVDIDVSQPRTLRSGREIWHSGIIHFTQ
jgi:hypothetical protein